MPKLFPIKIEVEELAVGKVMRLLNSMPGVAKFHLDMESKTTKTNGSAEPRPYKPRGTFEITGKEALTALLYGEGQPMTVPNLRKAFGEQGRSPASISSIIHEMMKDHELVRTADGTYGLSRKLKDRMRHRKASKKRG